MATRAMRVWVLKAKPKLTIKLTGYGQWEYNIQANNTESSKTSHGRRLAFAGLKFADYGSFDCGRNYGVMLRHRRPDRYAA
ncbi:MAG: porin [Escherichia coli]